MIKTYRIYKSTKGGVIWDIPPKLAVSMKLKENQLVVINYGSLTAQVKVVLAQAPNGNGNSMGFSGNALNRLKIPEGVSLRVKADEAGQIRLGPVIGILTFPAVIAGRKYNLYLNYARRMSGNGLLYIFAPGGIDAERKTITGYRYNQTRGMWQIGEFPYPDAVIDRIYPNNRQAQLKLEKVIGQNKIFNRNSLINKWEFFKILNNEPFLRNYTPETMIFSHASDLEAYMNKYPGVFLKPLDSMKGIGIVYVTKKNEGLVCQYMEGRKPVLDTITSAGEIFNVLKRACGRDRPYVIQAAVDRMKYHERPFNFRVLLTKNGSEQWNVPAICARVAPPGGFLTNRSKGADYILLKDILKYIIKDQPSCGKVNLVNEITELSVQTAAALDKELGPLGVLGIDVVVDTSGKLWLIEANGNSGRMRSGTKAEFPQWMSQVYDHPLAYAAFLSGFGNSTS